MSLLDPLAGVCVCTFCGAQGRHHCLQVETNTAVGCCTACLRNVDAVSYRWDDLDNTAELVNACACGHTGTPGKFRPTDFTGLSKVVWVDFVDKSPNSMDAIYQARTVYSNAKRRVYHVPSLPTVDDLVVFHRTLSGRQRCDEEWRHANNKFKGKLLCVWLCAPYFCLSIALIVISFVAFKRSDLNNLWPLMIGSMGVALAPIALCCVPFLMRMKPTRTHTQICALHLNDPACPVWLSQHAQRFWLRVEDLYRPAELYFCRGAPLHLPANCHLFADHRPPPSLNVGSFLTIATNTKCRDVADKIVLLRAMFPDVCRSLVYGDVSNGPGLGWLRTSQILRDAESDLSKVEDCCIPAVELCAQTPGLVSCRLLLPPPPNQGTQPTHLAVHMSGDPRTTVLDSQFLLWKVFSVRTAPLADGRTMIQICDDNKICEAQLQFLGRVYNPSPSDLIG